MYLVPDMVCASQACEPRISAMEDANPAAKRLRTDISSGAAAQLPACSSGKEDPECLAFDTVGAICVDAVGQCSPSSLLHSLPLHLLCQ